MKICHFCLMPIYLSLLFLLPLEAQAWNPEKACPPIPTDPVQAQIVAGELFSEAEAHYQSSQPQKALKEFLCSQRIMQHENTLFNIAQIARLEEHRDASLQILKDFVKYVAGNHKTQSISEIIDELENGPSEKEVAPLPATPDDAPAADSSSEDVAIASAEPTEDNSLQPAVESPKKGLKIAGLTLAGVGVGTLVMGGVFQGLAAKSQSSAESTDSYTSFTNEHDKMKRFQTGAIVGFVAGGVLTGAGVALSMVAYKKERLQSVAVVLTPEYRGVSLSRRF